MRARTPAFPGRLIFRAFFRILPIKRIAAQRDESQNRIADDNMTLRGQFRRNEHGLVDEVGQVGAAPFIRWVERKV